MSVTVVANRDVIIHTIVENIWEILRKAWQGAILALKGWFSSQKYKEWIEGTLLNLLMHQLAAQLTNDIVAWIQNGTTPRFVSESFTDYLGRAVDNAGGAFIETYLGMGWLCEPFDTAVSQAFTSAPYFQEEVECSLDDIIDNISNFYSDFNQGGWGAIISTAEPHNNFYGAYLMARAEKNRVVGDAEYRLQTDMDMGDGYMSPKDCQWFDATGHKVWFIDEDGFKSDTQKDVIGEPIPPRECAPIPNDPDHTTEGGYIAPCFENCVNLTPASSVKELSNKGVTNYYEKINQLIGAAAAKSGPLGIYVQAILEALVSRVTEESVGLLRAGTEDDPAGALPTARGDRKVDAGLMNYGSTTDSYVSDPNDLATTTAEGISVGIDHSDAEPDINTEE